MDRLFCCAAVAFTLASSAATAQAANNYPTKPIRLLTPFAAGGGSDIMARLIAPQAYEDLGQPIIVDNRPGGGGTLGAGIVVRAEPDGYTLIIVSGSYGANAAMRHLPYDSVTDITPIALIGTTGLLVTMYPVVPIKTIKEYLAYARANPGKLNYGSAGTGGLGHLAGELFMQQTGVKIVHVPYKGTGPVMNALIAGEVQTSFSSLVPSIPHVKAGRLRAVAVTTPQRSPALPNVPTVGETVPGFEVVHWYGMWGPKGLPRDIVTRWNREVAKVLKTESVRKWLANEGLRPGGGPPEEFRDRIKNDVAKWKRVVKEAHIVVN